MELLDRNRRGIWRLSDCSGTRTDSHLIRKQILNHLAKWWFSVYLQTKWLCVQVPLQSLVFILLWIYLFIGKKLHDQMRRPAFATLIIHVKLTIVNFVKRSMNLKIINMFTRVTIWHWLLIFFPSKWSLEHITVQWGWVQNKIKRDLTLNPEP